VQFVTKTMVADTEGSNKENTKYALRHDPDAFISTSQLHKPITI